MITIDIKNVQQILQKKITFSIYFFHMCILEKYCKDKFPTKCFPPSTLIDVMPIWGNTDVLGHNNRGVK